MTRQTISRDVSYFLQRSTVDPVTGCWNWDGAKSRGYGLTTMPDGTFTNAHRAAYRLLREDVPKNIQIHHLCGNRLCCNPDHLAAVTDMEHRRLDKNSMVSRTHSKRGHQLFGQNLSPGALARGKRICKICACLRVAKHRAANIDEIRRVMRETHRAKYAETHIPQRSSRYRKVDG